MPALLVADIDVRDPATYERYRTGNPEIVRKFGGRYIAVGKEVRVLGGDWVPRRNVIIQPPDMGANRAFCGSAEYADLRKIRWRSADSRLVAFETGAPA